jgi:hypothetical protein
MLIYIQNLYNNYPYRTILVLALFFRVLAVIFSPGFAMSDDHFLVIHVANQWLTGIPLWFNQEVAAGHSIIYPGLHYILFYILNMLGIVNPKILMIIVRLLHAVFSMLTVIYGYKIALKIADQKTANRVGLLLAIFWLAPFMSVRNLIEVVCIPPLVIGAYLLLPGEEKQKAYIGLVAGIIIAFAFIIRYQSLVIIGVIGLVLLFEKQWKIFWLYALGVLLTAFCVQGVADWIAWGYPFASLKQYIVYNLANRHNYVTGPWYQYLALLIGVFIPPVSLYLLYGCTRMWKRAALIFWPVLIFLLMHSYFPNKQERFILPVYPFIIILGVAGWNLLRDEQAWLHRLHRFIKGSWIWFWSVNFILLMVLTFNYGKKSQIEPMHFFRTQEDTRGIIVEYNRSGLPWFPKFYLGKDIPVFRLHAGKTEEQFLAELAKPGYAKPNYVFFYGDEKLHERIVRIEKLLKVKLIFQETVKPSFIDGLLHTMNPKHNKNITSHIYKIVNIEE